MEPLKEWYSSILDQVSDLSKGFTLIQPTSVLSVVIGYILFIWILKQFTKSKSPIDLTLFSIFHSLSLASIGLGLFLVAIRQSSILGFRALGNQVEFTDGFNHASYTLARVVWVAYFTNFIRCFDTAILVLQKRTVTLFHVCERIFAILLWWAITFFAPGGDAYLLVAFNGLVDLAVHGFNVLVSLNFFEEFHLTQKDANQLFEEMFWAPVISNALIGLSNLTTEDAKYPSTISKMLIVNSILLLTLNISGKITKNQR
eukprot:TRINITY_DN9251_c0_g1_i1.p1 TRINITY_DN9251_c0_g1~~TRINITY_DN9251_c0_g1_i1.p1  ORF type:complete len:258 (+),score=45.89 TRINITY_DN9251_c0_g1_i1:3-776(+)